MQEGGAIFSCIVRLKNNLGATYLPMHYHALKIFSVAQRQKRPFGYWKDGLDKGVNQASSMYILSGTNIWGVRGKRVHENSE